MGFSLTVVVVVSARAEVIVGVADGGGGLQLVGGGVAGRRVHGGAAPTQRVEASHEARVVLEADGGRGEGGKREGQVLGGTLRRCREKKR